MKISKLFHWLYFSVMMLPIFILPIFALAVRSDNNFTPIEVHQEKYEVVNFNQKIQNGDFEDNLNWYINAYYDTSLLIDDNLCTFTYRTTTTSSGLTYNLPVFEVNHIYYARCTILSNNTFDTSVSIGQSYVYNNASLNAGESKTIGYRWKVDTISGNYLYFQIGNRSASNVLFSFSVSNVNLFDFTQMYGVGNEPTVEDFENQFSNSFYDYDTGTKTLIFDGYDTFNDTDVGSQMVYTMYQSVNKYFNFDNVFNFGDLYNWLQFNFFSCTAPIGFFIFWHLLIYWLLVSLLWLLFDVLMYVPMLIHRWLDKAALS